MCTGTGAAAPVAVQAVLFDLDGTLVDTESDIANALSETLAAVGHRVSADRIRALAGRTLRDWFTDSLGMSVDQSESVYAAYVHRSSTIYAARAQAMPGATALLTALMARGIRIALVTTRVARSTAIVLEAAGWSDRFEIVVSQESAARSKPAPDPALYALAAMAVPPRHAAFIGNTEADMACGMMAGMQAVVGVVGERSATALRAAGATHICSNLEEVTALLLSD